MFAVASTATVIIMSSKIMIYDDSVQTRYLLCFDSVKAHVEIVQK